MMVSALPLMLWLCPTSPSAKLELARAKLGVDALVSLPPRCSIVDDFERATFFHSAEFEQLS
jgi:hypothetical protein